MTSLVITAVKLGPEQKLFNQLLEKIDDCARNTAELTRLVDAHRPERSSKMNPLLEKVRQSDSKLFLFLEARLQHPKGLTKKQRDNVALIAMELGSGLLRAGNVSEELVSAMERLDALTAQDEEEFVEGAFFDRKDEQLSEEDFEAFRKFAQEAWFTPKQAQPSKKKRSAKELAAEQEVLDAESALKNIYRKLASALHPDREPDEEKRAEKTLLMAQVNAANVKKDLLSMLRLQMQIDQIDPLAISSMADEKLRHFNRMLKNQLHTVQMEQALFTARIRDEFNLQQGPINAKALQKALRSDLLQLNEYVNQRNYEYVLVQVDKDLKIWSKHQVATMNSMLDFML